LRNAGPLGAEAFLIRIGILDDKRSKPFRMHRDYAKADRPAVVMKVEGVFVDLELLEKAVDRPGQIVKGVRIRRRWRGVALTETWKIRRYQMIARRQQGDKRIELARGRREATQEHDRRRVLRTSLAIENSDAVNRHAMIGRCRGCRL
jgi:hypothetical protein